jgi:transcription-repair coupling factor (superfamily II helicase)
VLEPRAIYLDDEDFFTLLKPHARWVLKTDDAPSAISAPLPNIAVNRRADDPLVNLRSFLLKGAERVLICAESNGRRETLQQYFAEYDLHPALCDDWTASWPATSR